MDLTGRIYFFKASLFLFFLLFSEITLSQTVKPDTLFLSNAKTKARKIYTDGIANESHLFNGVQYREMDLHSQDQGHPYFLSDDWIEGSVFYDGQQYQNVYMLYDIIHDNVIIDHAYSHFDIELIKEKIKQFSFSNHAFVRLVGDSLSNSPIHTGFYDLLYDGKVKVFAKRKKEINETIEAKLITITITEKDHYLVYKNGNYFSVRNKASVLKVFSDRKSALRKSINKAGLNFKVNRDLAIAELARFYDELEKQL